MAAPLQRAVYDALINDTALQAIIGDNVFDAPLPVDGSTSPQDYVTIGSEVVSNRATKSEDGAVHDFTVVVHSNAAGFTRSKQAAGAICDVLLDAQLTLTRGTLVYLRFLKARADAGTTPARRTISLRFRAFVEDATI